MSFILRPIGKVEKLEGKAPRVLIKEEFRPAMLNIDKYSHLHILWWATDRDTPEERQHVQGTPPREGAPLSGVFATRSPARPNPLCLTISRIEGLDEAEGILILDHMDARDGTPVLDIKPYLPSSDRVDDARVPPWFLNLVPRYTT
ncbi:MAG: S-adenosylmethionine-dependent methyltransferase [Candidatus Thorarchaeota archaeon]|nr:S-adenosylmethionine-dependent methyltransferase [Candidatus Thorarchaeota archaeon]